MIDIKVTVLVSLTLLAARRRNHCSLLHFSLSCPTCNLIKILIPLGGLRSLPLMILLADLLLVLILHLFSKVLQARYSIKNALFILVLLIIILHIVSILWVWSLHTSGCSLSCELRLYKACILPISLVKVLELLLGI